MEDLFVFNATIECWGAALSTIAFICVIILMHGNPENKGKYASIVVLYLVNSAALMAAAGGNYYNGVNTDTAKLIVSICNPAEYILNESLHVLISLHITSWLNRAGDVKIWRKALLPILIGYVLMIFANYFTHTIYYVDELNWYHRGPWFLLSHIPALLIQVITIILVLRYLKTVPMYVRPYLIAYLAIPCIGVPLYLFNYGLPILPTCFMLMAMLVMFATQHLSSMELIRKKQQLEKQEIQLLISQLQPHFLYNALIAIMGIDGNPPETVDAITRFSHYLRGNLSALNDDNTIPIIQELKHVEAFIELEKLRFGDKLKYDMDIEVSDFAIPPLSIEMLVENSIRHGFDGLKEAGEVKVRTKKVSGDILITVEDNGKGFNADEILNNPGTHVGLSSVKRRIEKMCNGKFEVFSDIGKGTLIKITLPDNNKAISNNRVNIKV